MSDNVVQLPPKDEPPELLVGPFHIWRVKVDGRIIPHLTGFHDGDKICLVVDNRFGASFSREDAHQVAWLIAQALAIGEGFPHLGAESKERPFAPMGFSVEGMPTP